MNTNSLRGKYGEDLAVSYLEGKGFEVLERNYRHRKGEIDVIALYKNVLLVFVEVKLRKDAAYGMPEMFVSATQQRGVIEAADAYIHAINWQKDIRFDIIAISGNEVYHIEDAFY